MTEAADAFVYRCLAATVPHWVVSGTAKTRAVHLPDRDSERLEPLCSRTASTWVRKDTSVYPAGWYPVCRDCRATLAAVTRGGVARR